MANATGAYPEELRAELIDKVFGDAGLNLNIARYNIGGGNASDVPPYLRPGGAVPGWWNPDAPLSDEQGEITSNYADRDRYRAAWTGENPEDYNFDADAAQLAWVSAIKDQVDTWEAFSNSPPYFMTESGFVSGGFNSSQNQIRTDSVDEFAKYLKTVVEHVEHDQGIRFDTIDPLNEPNTNYWGTNLGSDGWPTGGRQEGAHAGPGLQSKVVEALHAELAQTDTTTQARISAPDETYPGRFVEDWNGWTAEAKAAVDQLNVHTYGTGDRNRVRDIAKSAAKPLWMSEVEGNWGGNSWNPNDISNGLGIASLITGDLRELEPEAWVLWQPVEDFYNMEKVEKKNWGSIFVDFDCDENGDSVRRLADGDADPSCGIQVNSKYNTIRNYTHYIGPGDHLIAVNDNDATAAVDADGTGASLVYINKATTGKTVEIDLSQFGDIAAGATVTPVVTTQSPDDDRTANALVEGESVTVDPSARTATLVVPARSVTTFEISGVSGASATAPALRDGTSFTITGVQSGKPLAAGSSSTQLGSANADPGADGQSWTASLVVDEPGTSRDRYVLRLNDGRALTASGGNITFTTIDDADAAADPTVQWMLTTTDGTRFNILSGATDQVLDVANQATSEGARVGLWRSNWGSNQLWTLAVIPDYNLDTLSSLLTDTDIDPSGYYEWSVDAWQDARTAAQALVDAQSTDDAAIKAAYIALDKAFDGLVAKIEAYASFRPGQEWLDTEGRVIQAHGGQVVPSKDDDGKRIYYLYGEDRTFGYHSAPGVHVYSSYDLYNWTDQGVALRALSSREDFDEPYFEDLYGDYDSTQKDAVYRDLGTVPVPGVTPPIIERPKVIYNENTGKWVMWAHMDGPSENSTAQYAKAKAGVAVSDSPFGPFRYIDSYRLHHADPADPTNRAPKNPGMARDMNLFVDDDGTGYIIYSSEENATMFISKLNDEYTDLATPADEAVAGVDYNRIFIGQSRESPAIFKHDERYFLITSGTTGWSPNPSRYASATDIMGAWTNHGDPFPSSAQSNSFNSQPSSVIPIDRENGKYIYMGDRWNGGTDLKNAQMVWLPINMGEGGDTLRVEVPDRWTLSDLDQWAAWSVAGIPTAVSPDDGFDVPTVEVTQNGQTMTEPVEWAIRSGSFDTPGIVTLTGTLPEFGGRTIARVIPVVPDGVRYAVNAGGFATADWTTLMATAAEDGPVLNGVPDQPLGADPDTEATWGYVSPGSKPNGDAQGTLFSTLRYAVGGEDLSYRFGDLEPGSYSVYAGYADPWAQWADRGAKVTINGTVVEEDHEFTAEDHTGTYSGIDVGVDGELSFTLAETRGPDVQLSWLLVVLDQPLVGASATAETRCAGKRVMVETQVTNDGQVPATVTLTVDGRPAWSEDLEPGQTVAHPFVMGSAKVPAGVVSVAAQATIDGHTVDAAADAPYPATSCTPGGNSANGSGDSQ
ncbi:family 43 glycosylhydrolase [Agromyces sp. SYSU T00266]|uniref:family 43 glycosylhydrolase n=1 Tax=Agromyces zhanjiangensis TaxID=3158562 RepID=UPI003394526F